MTYNDRMPIADSEKDPQTLEREINQTRAEMNQTLDSLERKLTAGQMLDQLLKFFGAKGTELGSGVGAAFKNNPVPMLLTATGIGWMIFGSRGSPRQAYAADEGYDDRYYEGRRGVMSDIGEKLSGTTEAAGSRLSDSKDAAKETLNRATDTLKDTATRTKDAVASSVGWTAEAAQRQAQRTREGFTQMLEEQPLILGLMGIAIGAAIGAALPRTEQEDRIVGEMRDKAMNKAKEFVAGSYEKGREAARQGVESAVQKAS
jgi:hypothetical protein